jgi:RNA polymerase sigma-70 factor (ECF subfamily)
MAEPPPAARFPTTHWSRVVSAADPAAPGAKEALAELCAGYWYPLYAFIRRQGHSPEAAADLTQDYFARLQEKGVLVATDQGRGRFRAFLRTDCGFFLAHRRDRDHALKRGGGIVPLSIDARDAEGRYLREPADALTPERLFDRSWALTVLESGLARLADEYARSGRAALFERLEGVLSGGPRAEPYAAIAAQLNMTEGAVQAAVQRLRQRYRAILREQIAVTLDDPSEAAVDEEIHALFAALGR